MEQELEKWIDVLCPQCRAVIHQLNALAVVEFTVYDFAHRCGFAGNITWRRENISGLVPEHLESACRILGTLGCTTS